MAGTEKWCQSKDVHKGAEAIKAENWCQNSHSELSFGRDNPVVFSLKQTLSTTMASKEATEETASISKGDDGSTPIQLPECGHMGVINPQEVEVHQHRLKKVIEDFKKHTEMEEIREVMQKLVEDVNEACMKVYAPVTEASILNMVQLVRDPCGLVLCPTTERIENMLEDIMPEEETPEGEEVAHLVQDINPISPEAKDMIVALMDHTAVACHHVGLPAECLLTLVKICTPEQLMIIMKCSIHPMVQVVAAPGFLDLPTKSKKRDLPNDPVERVKITLLPNPDAESLKKEPKFSPTRLLAGVVCYCIQKHFGGGCTQAQVMMKFGLRLKILVLCVTGKKYLGGMDKKAAVKRKAAEKTDSSKKERRKSHDNDNDEDEVTAS